MPDVKIVIDKNGMRTEFRESVWEGWTTNIPLWWKPVDAEVWNADSRQLIVDLERQPDGSWA